MIPENRIVLYQGPMGSGKTKSLVKGPYDSTLFLVPTTALDILDPDREADYFRIHNKPEGIKHYKNVKGFDAKKPSDIIQLVEEARSVYDVRTVKIDEVHFVSVGLVAVVRELTKTTPLIALGGLDLDTELQRFDTTLLLAPLAGTLITFAAECDYDEGRCENQGRYSYAKFRKGERITPGFLDAYGTSCPEHFNNFRAMYANPPLPEVLVASAFR